MSAAGPTLMLHGVLAKGAGSRLERGFVLVESGEISWVGSMAPDRTADLVIEADDDEVIAPGFVDLQVNGAFGCDASSGADAISAISERLPEFGVTAFLPTLISSPLDLAGWFVGEVHRAEAGGARVLGGHLEGPFLNPRYRGAHDPDLLLVPTEQRIAQLVASRPRMVTLAPELPGGIELVEALTKAGVLVAAGHSGASYLEGRAAITAGVRFGTHIFNAMRPIHHRDPGVTVALLEDPRVTVGLIADGEHVHPSVCDLVIRSKGWRGVALTTDQTAAAGMPEGNYSLGARALVSDGRAVRGLQGELAGSLATMDFLVRATSGLVRDSLPQALAMASTVPARALGLARMGTIKPGSVADLVVLGGDLRPRITLVEGRVVYQR